MKRYKVLVSMLVVVSVVFSALGVVAAPVQGNVIVDSQFADPMGLVPGWATDVATSDLGAFLFAPILGTDEKMNLYPLVAESYSMNKANTDCTVKLRSGWKWQDGVEVTADDVKFTYDMLLSSEANSARRADILDYKLKSVEVKDKYTVVFHLSSKNMWFPYALDDNYWLPKHILGNVAPKDLLKNAYFQRPIGNGPFKFVEYNQGERIVLEPWKEYKSFAGKFAPKTPSDRYIFQIVPSQPTAVLKVQTGEANFVQVPAADIPAMKKFPNLLVKDFPDAAIMYVSFNLNRPVFADKKVRQAIAYAINKDAISKGVYKGFYTPAVAYDPPTQWWHNPNVKKYNYDLTKAKQLLDEAGWKVGRDGVREKNGTKFKFTLLALKGNVGREKTCVFIQSSLRQLGIQVEVRSLEWNTMNKKYLDAKNYDAAYISLSMDNIPTPANTFGRNGTFNNGSYYNPEVESLCDKVNEANSKEEVKGYMMRIQEIVAEELPVLVLLYPSNTYAMEKKTKDINVVFGNYYEPAEWNVDAASSRY